MFDGLSMSRVTLPRVDTIHAKGNKFDTGVKIKVTVDSKLNDDPVLSVLSNCIRAIGK